MADFSALAGRACPDWYARPQLGIFIHWGVFAVPAWAPRGVSIDVLAHERPTELFTFAPYAEWYSNALRIPEQLRPRAITPRPGARGPTRASARTSRRAAAAFDAEAWAALFAEAGARYVVMVTKHHDGYCLWPTEVKNPHRPGWHSIARLRRRAGRGGARPWAALRGLLLGRPRLDLQRPSRSATWATVRLRADLARLPGLRRRPGARADRPLPPLGALERHRLAGQGAAAGALRRLLRRRARRRRQRPLAGRASTLRGAARPGDPRPGRSSG